MLDPAYAVSAYCCYSFNSHVSGAVLEENIWGARQKVDDLFLVVDLKTHNKTTKSTLQKTLPVKLFAGFTILNTATVSKDLGGGNCPLPQRITAPAR